MQVTLQEIPAGLAGTDATVKKMAELVRRSLVDPRLKLEALKIVQAAGSKPADHVSAARALYGFVRSRIAFVNDPAGVESLQDPIITLYRIQAGDCDDHAILLAALAGSIGIPARFVTLGANAERFSHIYAELKAGGRWLPADTTTSSGFGVAPPALGVSKTYPINLTRGLAMAETVTQVRRDVAEKQIRDYVWRYLSEGWQQGKIDLADLQGYLSAIKSGIVEFSGSGFFEATIRQTVNDFVDYVYSNGIRSNKDLANVGFAELSGFFGDLWNGVKKVVKPAIVVGASIVNPAAGAAAAGVLYGGGGGGSSSSPGYAGGEVTVPAGGGTVTYTPGGYPAPAPSASDGLMSLLSNPVVLLTGAVVLILLLRKK